MKQATTKKSAITLQRVAGKLCCPSAQLDKLIAENFALAIPYDMARASGGAWEYETIFRVDVRPPTAAEIVMVEAWAASGGEGKVNSSLPYPEAVLNYLKHVKGVALPATFKLQLWH